MNCVMASLHLAGLEWSRGRCAILSAVDRAFRGALLIIRFCSSGRKSSLGQHDGRSSQNQAEQKGRSTVHGYLLSSSVANIRKRCQINADGRINPVRLSPLSCEKLTLRAQGNSTHKAGFCLVEPRQSVQTLPRADNAGVQRMAESTE